jgi:23S rRNA pseudouridine1911/1915/1917 synthase
VYDVSISNYHAGVDFRTKESLTFMVPSSRGHNEESAANARSLRRGERGPASRPRFAAKGLAIVYQDKDLIVVDKPAGLLSVATKRERDRTVHSLLTEYTRKGCGRGRKHLFVVHRLDRDTSGLLIFAKSEEAMVRLKDRWKEFSKKYLAVVHGKLKQDFGIITSYLAEDDQLMMYSTSDSSKGKLARTAYRVIKETVRYSLLEVTLLTGRKNQIRVHMADIGNPVVGDTWYSKNGSKYPRLALHAWSLSFLHPFSGKPLSFTSDIPTFFTELVGPISQE